MCIIKRYNGKVLTVNGFYALKCIGTHLYHPIVSDTNHWEKTEIPNSQLGISVLPTSSEQGIIMQQNFSLTTCSLGVVSITISFSSPSFDKLFTNPPYFSVFCCLFIELCIQTFVPSHIDFQWVEQVLACMLSAL